VPYRVVVGQDPEPSFAVVEKYLHRPILAWRTRGTVSRRSLTSFCRGSLLPQSWSVRYLGRRHRLGDEIRVERDNCLAVPNAAVLLDRESDQSEGRCPVAKVGLLLGFW
jgi:hypothetical protein